MKVSEYLRRNQEGLPPDLAEMVIGQTDVWSNNACYGYCLQAMQFAGFRKPQIEKMIRNLYAAFDTMSVEEAEAKWDKY